MSQRFTFEQPKIKPVTTLVIEESEPVRNEGANISFSGSVHNYSGSIPENPERVGYVEGFFEHDNYADISDIMVEPHWRGQGFGTQLFQHFVRKGLEANVESISLSAANERTAHLMGTIPGVKEFTFTGDRVEPLDFTIEEAVKFLEEARIRQGLTAEDEKTEVLKSIVRITAHMR